ncbi:MAG: hypothetical protein ACR2PX_05205 [Endozoicomonas sp.]|uniref:hypothetical protein n=1 Tax=Endozoicomonas sp. TaxID=1892382 RepID=UPI003D9B051C
MILSRAGAQLCVARVETDVVLSGFPDEYMVFAIESVFWIAAELKEERTANA